ncbi:MAG: glycosyl hydrolase family 18 protein [Bacillota bacterium]
MNKHIALILVILLLLLTLSIPASAGNTFGSRNLSIGMSGADVKELQTFLVDFGYLNNRISGYFDNTTRSVVAQFQKANSLPADGVVKQADFEVIAQLREPVSAAPEPEPASPPEPEPIPDPSPDPVPEPEPVQMPEPILKPPAKRHVLVYYTVDYQGDVLSYNSLKTYGNQVDSIATFSVLVDGNGNIVDTTPKDGVSMALNKDVIPLALIHNYRDGGFNAADAHSLLTNSANRQRLIKNMITLLQKEGYQGVNIDIENVPFADRHYYTALVQEFKEALEPLGYLTTVSIPAKTWDAPKNAWSGAFDYAAIGKHADWIQIMTYDEHWFGGKPGPVASLPWVENVIKYAVTVIPPGKILLGIATYGYDWSSSSTKVVTYHSVKNLIKTCNIQPQWHNAYGVPYFYYHKDGVKHEVWYENADSARLKMDLVNKYGLMGVGIWRLGYEDDSFWRAVAEKMP